MQHLCGCPDFGEYTGAVELVPPESLKRDDGRGICVDVCLALEIQQLWGVFVTTTNSCCGHGKMPPTICVIEADEPKMLLLGYEYGDEHNQAVDGAPHFIAKTMLEFSQYRWIYRNDEPAHSAESHAYDGNNDTSLCGAHDRSKFDWTEMDGERCIQCQQLTKETT